MMNLLYFYVLKIVLFPSNLVKLPNFVFLAKNANAYPTPLFPINFNYISRKSISVIILEYMCRFS
jgi:hypothetical protein